MGDVRTNTDTTMDSCLIVERIILGGEGCGSDFFFLFVGVKRNGKEEEENTLISFDFCVVRRSIFVFFWHAYWCGGK